MHPQSKPWFPNGTPPPSPQAEIPPSETAAPLSFEELSRYRTEGWAVARGVVSAAELEELRVACEALCTRAQTFTRDVFIGATFFNLHRDGNPFARDLASRPQVPGLLRRVTYPYALSPVLNAYRAHPRLLGIIQTLLGPDLVQIVNQVNFNPPGHGTGWGWHQDYRFRKPGVANLVEDFVQTILAIDLCSTATGGLRLIPGSHRLGDLKLDTDNENAERFFDARQAVTPVLEPGDMVLFNSHIIHGSTPNLSPAKRRVYINGYARATARIGMPVLRAGVPTSDIQGRMEYEGDLDLLPKAAKY